eukprot:a348319_22.p1 GENE.a348319_22~~a348319_22.p1  ORF type:complete len:296 (+),score=124.42 a348319_22:35-889(+)
MPRYMVAVDDSKNAESAFLACVQMMNPERDELIVLAAAMRSHIGQYSVLGLGFEEAALAGVDAYSLVRQANEATLRISRATVASYLKNARDLGFANVVGLTGLTDHVGEFICKVAADRKVDFLCLGKRGMSALKRVFIGSVSKYVLDHAECSVIIVKGEAGPEWAHDASVEEVRGLEEAERARRVADYMATEKARTRMEFLSSSLNKNISIMAEEAERARRVSEDKAAEASDAASSKAAHDAAVAAEEAERARRISEGKTTSALSQVVNDYLLEVQMTEVGLLD